MITKVFLSSVTRSRFFTIVNALLSDFFYLASAMPRFYFSYLTSTMRRFYFSYLTLSMSALLHSRNNAPPPPRLFSLVRGLLSSFVLAFPQIWRGGRLLFFLVGFSFLVLTACAGGGSDDSENGSDGGGGPGDGPPSSLQPLEVALTFAPIPDGFQIGNQSDFGEMVSLRITATGGSEPVERTININEFADDSYNLTGLGDQSNWTFAIIGTLDDGRQQRVAINFVWPENEADHDDGGIGSGLDTDGDRRADSVDDDLDGDDVNNEADRCDDPDAVGHETNWQSNASSDNDGDGCRDETEDTDDDNDGLDDTDTKEQLTNSGGMSCRLLADCDNDGVGDSLDDCSAGETGWMSNPSTDSDMDGCRDATEDTDDDNDNVMDGADIDADGDGLIEIGTAAELDAVRYALEGDGRRSSADGALDDTGCGGANGITSCSGYELVADISLAAYKDGKGWQPLGNDTDNDVFECQGPTFDGTFEGNGWTISDLSINRPAEDCVGLFGYMAEDSEIRNLTLHAEAVIGRRIVGSLVGNGPSVRIVSSSLKVAEVRGSGSVGGLVGSGNSAQINSSSVEVAEVRGAGNVGARINVGGLVGNGEGVRIHSSSVVAGNVSGTGEIVGGLVGFGPLARIHSSSVVAGKVSGVGQVGGLLGWSQVDGDISVEIYSSSVVVGEVSGGESGLGNVGGLVGDGKSAKIYSSSVVAGAVRGVNSVGGLVGLGSSARIHSSSVVVGEVSGMGGVFTSVGGLAGNFNSGKVAYSYVVSGSNTAMMGTTSDRGGVASYWDSDVLSSGSIGNIGEAKTTSDLRSPTGYTDIYDRWDEETNIFSDGNNVPLAVWCDRDHSGSIEADEQIPDNLIWDFGTSSQYPAIRCTPLAIDNWRSWWSLEGTPAKPTLNRARLDELLP